MEIRQTYRAQNVSELYKLADEILEVYNIRWAELRDIDKANLVPGNFQIVKGRKGSGDIIIRDREILQKLDSAFRKYGAQPFTLISYKQYYRHVWKTRGNQIRAIKKKKNYKVTHASRYFAVARVRDEKTIKAILHHNPGLRKHQFPPAGAVRPVGGFGDVDLQQGFSSRQYRQALISYQERPAITGPWVHGLRMPQITRMSMTSWRSRDSRHSLAMAFIRPTSIL